MGGDEVVGGYTQPPLFFCLTSEFEHKVRMVVTRVGEGDRGGNLRDEKKGGEFG